MESRKNSVAAVAVKIRAFSNAKVLHGYALMYLLLFLNMLDALTTHIGLQLGATEANPIMSNLIGEIGELPTYVIKLLIVLIAAIVIIKMGKNQALGFLCLGMTAVVTSNLVIFTQSFIG